MKSESYTLVVDVDCLLDVRLGVLSLYNLPMVKRLLDAGYRTRTTKKLSDLVPDFNDAEFEERYANRDVTALHNARITGLFPLILKSFDFLNKQALAAPMGDEITLKLNMHRYVLSEKEREKFLSYLSSFLPPFIGVEIIHMSDKELTCSWLRDNVNAIIHYDFDLWLKEHIDQIATVRMPELDFTTLGVYLNKTDVDKLHKLTEDRVLTGLQATEVGFVGIMRLTLAEAKYFSIIQTE